MRRVLSPFLLLIISTSCSNAQWTSTDGPSGGVIYSLATSGNNLFAGTSGGGVFLSTDSGSSWTPVDSGLTSLSVGALAISDSNLFAGTSGGVYLSTNSGTSWTADTVGLRWLLGPGDLTREIWSLTVSGNNVFAGTYGGGVFLSTNTGSSWVAVNTGLTNPYVWSFAVSGNSLFAATDGGGVFLSTDNGAHWAGINSGLTTPYFYYLAVSPSGSGGTNLFAASEGEGVFLSTNNGTSWTAVNNGFRTNVFALAAVPNGTGGAMLFAGTSGGVYLSTNNGTSWTSANAGLGNNPIYTFAVLGTYLFAGASGGGVWRRPLEDMVTSVNELSGEVPKYFRLEQNYPNPFNPTTTIRYELPKMTNVTLRIFNTLGQEVALLVNGQKDAGNHQVAWNANVPSGIYFYRLQAGEYLETKRMILLK